MMAAGTKIKLYWKRSPQEVDWFIPYLEQFEWRQYDPWHLQTTLPNGLILNVWPHVRKAMIQDEPPVTRDLEALLAEALTRAPFLLIEDFE